MVDPFQTEARRERLTLAAGLLLMIALLGILASLAARAGSGDQLLIEGTVVRVATYAHELGDMPILTVRLDDGSIHQLRASWAAAKGCGPGSSIALLKRGSRLRVGMRGCNTRASA